MEENPLDSTIDKKEEARLFQELSHIEGIDDYLKQTMGMDIMRYFSVDSGASGEDIRAQIKGAYNRTQYLRKLILRERAVEDKNKA